MAIGDSQRDDVVIERRRAAVIAFVAAAIVLFVLAAGGALGWGPAIVSALALGAMMIAYLAAARQADGPRRSAADAAGAPTAAFAIDDSARAVLDALPDPVAIVRLGGRVEALNAAARRELRAPQNPAGSVDAPFAALVREPRVLDAVEAALTQARSGDVEFKDAAPRERHLRALVAPFSAGPGAAPRAVVVLRDESAIKQAERARADFLANASHELRTPLASLTGFIETLRGHARDDAVARNRFLGIMSAQAERMRRLIDDLLSLSRLEQSEHVAPRGTADLAKIAGDVADALSLIAADRGVNVVLKRFIESARVAGDRDELVQVVQNLVDNAIKYSAEGGEVLVEVGVAPNAAAAAQAPEPLAPHAARLTLLAPADAADVPYAWIRVSDHGRGIERRHLPRLSERFFRGDPDEVSGVEGTGLGLAIVRQVMARHRGGVAVESALGTGSRFTMFARLEGAPGSQAGTAVPGVGSSASVHSPGAEEAKPRS
jgi:two-component system phosphate regulon sensor histidine kinase PhoR